MLVIGAPLSRTASGAKLASRVFSPSERRIDPANKRRIIAEQVRDSQVHSLSSLLDRSLPEVIDPLVVAGRLRWESSSEMADPYCPCPILLTTQKMRNPAL